MREAKREGMLRWQTTWAVALAASALAAISSSAQATMRYHSVELSGNIETQNLVRHQSPDELQFVQNRNTLRVRLDWSWVQNGRFLNTVDIPFLDRSNVFLLYRGAYDGFYDIAPGGRQIGQERLDDIVGGPINGNQMGTLGADGRLKQGLYSRLTDSDRTDLKFDNTLREAYIDLKLKSLPLSFRLGRQQVIWGESDQFRLMDIWNPLDISWHFQQESWDNIRVPLWLAKGLWDIGDFGPLSNTFLEVVYNPFDFQPGIKAGFLPEPWALPFPNPLRDGQISVAGGASTSPIFNLGNTSLRQGDFKRNPQDASEIGARFHGVTPQGLEFALNYLYGRGRGVGAASPFAVKLTSVDIPCLAFMPGCAIGNYQSDINNPGSVTPVSPVNIKAEVIHPYMHIFGLTGNYFEGDFTQAVLRFETAYAMGEPFQTTEPEKLVPITFNGAPSAFGTAPLGFTKRDVWAGMLGFDRPTWIRFLNPRATWFLSGQFFWNYTTGGQIDSLVGNAGAGDSPYFGNVGRWVTGPFAGQVERRQDGSIKGNGDNVRQWEHLITMAATSFYRGGTLVPFVADAWDPVNDNNEVLWNLDYFFTNNLILSLQQKFYMTYGSKAVSNDPWFAGGRFTRRDETGVKVTYQF